MVTARRTVRNRIMPAHEMFGTDFGNFPREGTGRAKDRDRQPQIDVSRDAGG
jgi:hypothetical protein